MKCSKWLKTAHESPDYIALELITTESKKERQRKKFTDFIYTHAKVSVIDEKKKWAL